MIRHHPDIAPPRAEEGFDTLQQQIDLLADPRRELSLQRMPQLNEGTFQHRSIRQADGTDLAPRQQHDRRRHQYPPHRSFLPRRQSNVLPSGQGTPQ